MDAREAAWSAIHDLLPDRGRVGPPDYDPATPTWTVTARPPNRGRRSEDLARRLADPHG